MKGTTRDVGRAERQGHLTSLPGAQERLELIQADLLHPGAFDLAVAGCDYVLHIASPYVVNVEDPKRDLLDPAVGGTLRVLHSCRAAETVKRVVLTQSFAAIVQLDAAKTFTEDH